MRNKLGTIGSAAVGLILLWAALANIAPRLFVVSVERHDAVAKTIPWLWNPGLIWLAAPLAYGWIVYLVLGLMSRLTRIERADADDRARRDKEFQDWLTWQAQVADQKFTQKHNDLAAKTEYMQKSIEESMNRFYQRYHDRLVKLEGMGAEGPLVDVPHTHYTFQFTTAAHEEYRLWDDEMRLHVRNAFTWHGSIRFGLRDVQGVTQDLWSHNGREWLYDVLAALPETDRQALLTPDLDIWKWYEKQKKYRKDGRRRQL